MAVIFAFMSADEASSIHEKFGVLVRQNVSDLGLAFGQWTLVYVPLVLVFAIVYWSFLKSLWPAPGRMFALAGAIFVTGSVVFELLAGYRFTGIGLGVAEELFEILGILLWMRALLVYMSRENIPLRVRLVID